MNGLVFGQTQINFICLCSLWKGSYIGTTKWLRCHWVEILIWKTESVSIFFFFNLLISCVRHHAWHFHPSIHLFNNYCLSWTAIPSREREVRPRLVLVMMQSDGLCGRRKVWNLPASWKNKPGTQWLARSVSGVASQSCAYLWEELKSSLKWSENVSQKRLDTEETTLLCTSEMGENL